MKYKFQRIRELPEEEREEFRVWIEPQTRPLILGIDDEDQDFFYKWDYDRWKQGLSIID